MLMTSNHENGDGDTIATVSWPHYSAIEPFIHAYNCDILIDKSKIFAVLEISIIFGIAYKIYPVLS